MGLENVPGWAFQPLLFAIAREGGLSGQPGSSATCGLGLVVDRL